MCTCILGRAYISQSTLLDKITCIDEVEEGVVVTHEYSLDGDRGKKISGMGDSSTVVIRCMTCLVRGGAVGSVYQNNLAKLRARAADAIQERRTLVERQQQLAERSKSADGGDNDDDDDDVFLLDPSMLTVQDLKLNLTLPGVKLFVGTVYVKPSLNTNISISGSSSSGSNSSSSNSSNSSRDVRNKGKGGKRLKDTSSVPLILIAVKGIDAAVVAKNNPWEARFSVVVGSIKLHDKEAERKVNTEQSLSPSSSSSSSRSQDREQSHGNQMIKNKSGSKRVEPIISIPNISLTMSASQTSSIGRYVDGSLDVSCFEWSAELSLMSFKIQLKPSTQSFGYPVNMRSLWKTYRILEHLWMPKFGLGLGYALMSLGGEGDTQVSSEESTLRLGGMYDEFPIHVNYCKEILGGTFSSCFVL